MKQNNYDLTIDFYADLNKAGLRSRYILFDQIKYINIAPLTINNKRKCTDLNGGFLHKSKLIATAKELNISVNTLRQRLSDFNRIGWVNRTHTGWKLISWKKIVHNYQPNIKKIAFKEKTEQKLNEKLAYEIIERSIKKQVHAKYSYESKSTRKNLAHALLSSSEFSISCRTLAKKLGYSSPATGIRMEQILKKQNLIKIEKRQRKLCDVEFYEIELENNQGLINRCFILGGTVYERLCNNLIPVKKDLASRANTFLKQARLEKNLNLSLIRK